MNELENIKPGDKAIRQSGYGSVTYHVVSIERVTATQIILKNGERFRKDGRLISANKWSSTYLYPYSEEMVAKVQAQNELAYLKNVVWENVSADVRHQIVELLKKK